MKTNHLMYSLLMLSVASLLSCSPVIYSNVGHNTPMFEEKGEFAFNGSYAEAWTLEETTETKGFSLQAAYAIDDRWAAIGGLYSLKSAVEVDETFNWDGNGTYWEIGGGRYGKLGMDWLAYEVFGGFGTASIKNEDYLSSDYLNINFSKPFIQPSVGFVNRYVDVIFTPRIGYVIFADPSYNFGAGEIDYEIPKDGIVFEPGVSLRAGYQGLKLLVQYNYSTYSYGSNTDLSAGVNNNYFSFGLHLLISNRYK